MSAAYASLVYVGSLVGYVMAPSHLCLVLSAEYYGARLHESMRHLAYAILPILTLAILIPTLL